MALHAKLMGISPLPATLADLVDKAREFDRVYRMVANTAISNASCASSNRQPVSGRAVLTEDDSVNVNASSSQPPDRAKGRLTKEERDHRFKNNLCLYCGKPGHILKECFAKTQAIKARGGRNVKARGAFVEDPDQEEAPNDHPAQIGALYREIFPADKSSRLAAEDEDF